MSGWEWARLALAVTVSAPLAVAFVPGRTVVATRVRVALSVAAATASALTLVSVATAGRFTLEAGGAARPVVGLVADPLTAILLLAITGVGALVQGFATRYLTGDVRADRFSRRSGLVIAAMAVAASSTTLVGLLVGWLVAGWSFVAVAGYRPDLSGVVAARRSTLRSLSVGDACLVAAVGLCLWRVGDTPVDSRSGLAHAVELLGPWHQVVAVFVAVAALSRCAQAMFRPWLTRTIAAPTPACALLHAGVINGGGILLVRLGPLGATPIAMALVLVLTGFTIMWSGLVGRHQSDVKGALANSTSAQMGFMLAECAVGAYPAAVVHLVGHASYKAYLFFSSGSTVPSPTPVAPAGRAPSALAVGGAVLLGGLATGAAVWGVARGEGGVLAAFAAVSAGGLTYRWARRRPRTRGWRWPALAVVAAGGYGVVAGELGRFVSAGTLTPHGTIPAYGLLTLGLVVVAGFSALRVRRVGPRLRAWAIVATTAPRDRGRRLRRRPRDPRLHPTLASEPS